jgi:hypothetical protein
MFWFLGAALFAHVVSFFGISFNDQSVFAWYALIAIIVAATTPILGAGVAGNVKSLATSDVVPQFAYASASPDILVQDDLPGWTVIRRRNSAEW